MCGDLLQYKDRGFVSDCFIAFAWRNKTFQHKSLNQVTHGPHCRTCGLQNKSHPLQAVISHPSSLPQKRKLNVKCIYAQNTSLVNDYTITMSHTSLTLYVIPLSWNILHHIVYFVEDVNVHSSPPQCHTDKVERVWTCTVWAVSCRTSQAAAPEETQSARAKIIIIIIMTSPTKEDVAEDGRRRKVWWPPHRRASFSLVYSVGYEIIPQAIYPRPSKPLLRVVPSTAGDDNISEAAWAHIQNIIQE